MASGGGRGWQGVAGSGMEWREVAKAAARQQQTAVLWELTKHYKTKLLAWRRALLVYGNMRKTGREIGRRWNRAYRYCRANISAMMHATDQTSMACVYSVKDSITSGARYQRVATYLMVVASKVGMGLNGDKVRAESGCGERQGWGGLTLS